MLIIDKDNLQAFITKAPYGNPEGFGGRFIVSFTIQINGKIKTAYADLNVITKKEAEEKYKDQPNVGVGNERQFVIDDQMDLLRLINTLHHLGYDCGDTMLMRDKISQYVSNYF